MLTKGEPLNRELRFRLRGYTGLFLFLFLVGHASAYAPIMRACRCQSFPVPLLGADTVRVALYCAIALLYMTAWVEVFRMLYVRWWPHWGTMASDADPGEAAKGIPRYIVAHAALAVSVCMVIFGCEAFRLGHQPLSGWQVGAGVGVLGSFVGLYGAWFIRVIEPVGPIPPSRNS